MPSYSAKTGERVFQWELDHLQLSSKISTSKTFTFAGFRQSVDISSSKVRVNFSIKQLNKGLRIPEEH